MESEWAIERLADYEREIDFATDAEVLAYLQVHATLALSDKAHTANLIAHRSYLLEQAFDRKLSDREQEAVELLNTQIAERLGLNV